AGYKGYGLALVVELLTGILADAAYGPNILSLWSVAGKANLGQFFMAIDPAAVGGAASFIRRLEGLLDQLTTAPLSPGAPGLVLFPGHPEAERAEHQAKNGIAIDTEHHDSLVALGARHGAVFPAARPIGG